MPRKSINYDKTHFYKIVCKDFTIQDCYVGHTTDWIKRRSAHKQNSNKSNLKSYNLHLYKFIREHGGWDNWEMIWIKTLNCENGMEARSEERKCKEELNATLNGQVPSRTRKQYREEEQSQIQEYRNNHKEDRQQWYEKRRNELLQKQGQVFMCQCGHSYTRSNKSRHLKSKMHQQYIQSLEQSNPQE